MTDDELDYYVNSARKQTSESGRLLHITQLLAEIGKKLNENNERLKEIERLIGL